MEDTTTDAERLDRVTIDLAAGQLAVRFTRPSSPTLLRELFVAPYQLGFTPRVFAACLGLCWEEPPSLARLRQQNAAAWLQHPKRGPAAPYRYDIGAYGGEVMDDLLQRGASYDQVRAAGMLAYNFACAGLGGTAAGPTEGEDPEQEVARTADFSEAPGPSTS